MSRFRQVPGITQGPKGFSPANFVPMQSPLSQPPQQPQSPAAVDGIAEQMQDMAMEIYCRLAVKHIAITVQDNADNEQLQELARLSQAAALAYFQAMGVPTNG